MTLNNLSLPTDVSYPLLDLMNREIEFVIIGGAVRDYFFTGSWPKDIDVEVRPLDQSKNIEDFAKEFETAMGSLNFFYEKLPFHVYRFCNKGYEIEFSFPRVEKFTSIRSGHHSDFEPEFDFSLSYEKAWQRRDFTLNSIGLKLIGEDEAMLIDPFNGKAALESKTLKPCGEDFFQDNVRFLRLIRFSIKYDLNIDQSILKKLTTFNFLEVSKHYFFYEGFKSNNFVLFCKTIKKLLLNATHDFKDRLPELISIINELDDKIIIKNEESLLIALALIGKGEDILATLGISEKKFLSLTLLFQSLNHLSLDNFLCQPKLSFFKWKEEAGPYMQAFNRFVRLNDLIKRHMDLIKNYNPKLFDQLTSFYEFQLLDLVVPATVDKEDYKAYLFYVTLNDKFGKNG